MKSFGELTIMSRLGIIFLTWRRHLQKKILPYGITLKQWHVLRHLDKHNTLSPSRIAEMLFCDRPTATYILGNMKKNGWIESAKDPDNLKQRQVRLTASGHDALESLSEFRPAESFDPLSCFTDEERTQLEHLLKKLHHHLKTLPEG